MTFHDDMERVDYDIDVRGADSSFHQKRLSALKHAIRHAWMAATRDAITSIHPSDEYDGAAYAVEFADKKPPTLGGYTDSIARYGWGYLAFNEDSLYLAQLLQTDDGYTFEGRDKTFDLPAIRRVPKLPIEDERNNATNRDDRRMETLRDDLQAVWPVDTLETIDCIKPSSGSRNSYIIDTESNTEFEEDDDGELVMTNRPVPDVPVGKHIDVLLQKGWCVSGVKGSSMFISRLKTLPQNKATRFDAPRNYMFEGAAQDDLMYMPSVCDRCEEHEASNYVVVDERETRLKNEDMMPVTASVCNQCREETRDKYPTMDEYHEAEDPQVG